ncbi:MAG: T9SS type A sorting domain-containing protein [Flavobacteriales bacterium]
MTHPNPTQQLRLSTLVAFSVLLISSNLSWGQVECANCPIVFDNGEVPTGGCSQELDNWEFEPAASVLCDSEVSLPISSFVADLRSGWTDHAGITSLGMGPDGAIRLFGLSSLGYAPSDYFIETEPLAVQELPNGRIRVTGEVANNMDSELRWELHLVLHNALAAEDWLNSSPNHQLVVAYGCEVDTSQLTTYVLDPAHSHLEATSGYDSGFLQLSHMPLNAHRRFQLGEGGNSHNCEFGLGGWFAWEGQIDGTEVLGLSGDLIIDLTESTDVFPECGDPIGLGVATAFHAACNSGASMAVEWIHLDDLPPVVESLVCPPDTVWPGILPDVLPGPDELGHPEVIWSDNCPHAMLTSFSYADAIDAPANCSSAGAVNRTFTMTAEDDCGNVTQTSCTQTIFGTDVPPIPGIQFPPDTLVQCDATSPADLPEAVDACGNALEWIIEDEIGPPLYVLEASYSGDFDDCNTTGFVAQGGSTMINPDGWEGTCAVQLAQYVGMLPNNFYFDGPMTGYGTYEVLVRTESFLADALLKLYAGPGLISPALIFSIRPSGSDNPGVNVLGFGIQAATIAPPVYASEWFAVRIEVLPSGISLFLNNELWWSDDLPESLPISGHFKLAASGAVTYDNVQYSPWVPCENEYTIHRTWSAEDAAGNSLTHEQVISVVDEQGPDIILTAGSSMDWPCDIPLPQETGEWADASDCSLFEWGHSDSLLNAGNACSGGAETWLRTYTAMDACGNASQAEQVIHVIDTLAPILVTECALEDGDTISVCPGTEDWDWWTSNCEWNWQDNCSGPNELNIEPSNTEPPTGQCNFQDPSPLADGEDCEGNSSHGMRLFGLNGFSGDDYYTTTSGVVATSASGDLHFQASYANMDLPEGSGGFDLDAHCGPAFTWEEWQLQENNAGYFYGCPELPDLHESWSFHVLDSAVLTGYGVFAGLLLNLYHPSPDNFYGLQWGVGASSKNDQMGFGAWFEFEGELDGVFISGSGNLFADLLCQESWTWTRTESATDCSGNTTTHSYTLLVEPENCSDAPIGMVSAFDAGKEKESASEEMHNSMAPHHRHAVAQGLHLMASPNPSEGQTRILISSSMDREAPAVLEIYNAQGQLMSFRWEGRIPAGEQKILNLNETFWPPGPYTLRLRTDDRVASWVWLNTP